MTYARVIEPKYYYTILSVLFYLFSLFLIYNTQLHEFHEQYYTLVAKIVETL